MEPLSEMNESNGIPECAGGFPGSMAGAPAKALTSLYYGEATRAIDSIAPERLTPCSREWKTPWFTKELRSIKHMGRRLETLAETEV